MSSIVYQCNVDTLCTCVVKDSLHISDLKPARELQWGLCFLACLLQADIFHNLSWFMVWKHFFQWDSETANALEGCHVITQCKLSRLLLPKLSLSFFFFIARPLCYAVSQVKVCRVRVDTVSSHPSSLEVWKYSLTRPPPPPPPPPLSFHNYLSISDKQLHQKTELSSVNTELPDMIHQWEALCSEQHLLTRRCYLCGEEKI